MICCCFFYSCSISFLFFVIFLVVLLVGSCCFPRLLKFFDFFSSKQQYINCWWFLFFFCFFAFVCEWNLYWFSVIYVCSSLNKWHLNRSNTFISTVLFAAKQIIHTENNQIKWFFSFLFVLLPLLRFRICLLCKINFPLINNVKLLWSNCTTFYLRKKVKYRAHNTIYVSVLKK